jgi:hypothetical protein
LLATKEPDESGAEASFRKAIAITRGQGAKSFELRAATSLAGLLAHQGRREEARALLAPVYGWFTEGFDTADLKEAKGLLDELRWAGPRHVRHSGADNRFRATPTSLAWPGISLEGPPLLRLRSAERPEAAHAGHSTPWPLSTAGNGPAEQIGGGVARR